MQHQRVEVGAVGVVTGVDCGDLNELREETAWPANVPVAMIEERTEEGDCVESYVGGTYG